MLFTAKITRVIFLFSLSLFCTLAFSQTSSISGKITDESNEPLTGAVAELRNVKDSSMAKVNVADAKGVFTFENVKAGNYYIKTSFIGFVNHLCKEFSFDATTAKELPVIKMASSSTNLQQANITAFKPLIEVKADKTVFNVENSINSTGSTAYELLQKAPGVVVDNNDNISLKGRGGVMVQIDGKPARLSETDLADYLKSIQSTDVEAIELVSNPSSKYEAEGTAGIINIRLKKNKNYGTNGILTLGYAIGKYSKYNTALSLNNRSKKFNVYGNYSNNWGDRGNEFYLYRRQDQYVFNQSSISKRSGLSHNYKAGVDYTMNSRNNFGIMVNGNYADTHGKQKNRNNISGVLTDAVDSILKSDQTFTNHTNNFNFNLNHHYKDTLGRDLTTDFDYGYYNGKRNTYIPNEYTSPDGNTYYSTSYNRSVTNTTINIYSLKSDYSQNFLKGKLGLGYKLGLVQTDNDYNFYNIEGNVESLIDSSSNNFVYTENVNAAYINYQRTFKKFDIQAGVRMENTNSEGELKTPTSAVNENTKKGYVDFFPSAGITYNANKNNAFALVYSSRVDRPNYQELNPFIYKLDELSYRQGNPFLNPQYSNKIEISHTYKYTITTSAGYSHTTDFFAQITDTDSGGVGRLVPKNLATEDVYNIDFSASLQPLKWYSFYLNAGVFHSAYKADFGPGKTINAGITAFNGYMQNTFKLPFSFTFEISGWYNSGGIWAGSFKNKGQGSLDLGLQKKLFKDRATLKLSYTDILHTSPWDSYSVYSGINSRAYGNWESQQFRVAFTWRFGNNQMKGMRQRSAGSEQEQKRISGDN